MPTDDKHSGKHLQIYDETLPLKQRVFLVLNKYPNISPKQLCKLLSLDYKRYRNTVKTYKYNWKKSKSKEKNVLNSLKFHNVRYFGYALTTFDLKNNETEQLALKKGWNKTKAKNHMKTWNDPQGLGRIEWFRTGRINAWIKKPANVGKMKQLLCNAFYPHFIQDINLFTTWADSFSLKGFHLVLPTGEKLPYAKIGLLKESNGVVAVIGDSSHKDGLELQVTYPDWLERNEKLAQLTLKTLENFAEILTASIYSHRDDRPKGMVI